MNRSAAKLGIIILLAGLGLQAAQAQPIPDATQLVVRLNPKRDPGKLPYTVADCVVVEPCMAHLTQKLLQAGGNPALLAEAKQVPTPDVSGDQSVYQFKALQGESFCKALLLKFSMAPNFGESAPEVTFSASKKSVVATVRLPEGENKPVRTWFDGVLVLLSVKDVAFAESSCSLKNEAQETACKKNCEHIEF